MECLNCGIDYDTLKFPECPDCGSSENLINRDIARGKNVLKDRLLQPRSTIDVTLSNIIGLRSYPDGYQIDIAPNSMTRITPISHGYTIGTNIAINPETGLIDHCNTVNIDYETRVIAAFALERVITYLRNGSIRAGETFEEARSRLNIY